MTYAYLTVKVNLEAGSFVRTPEEAKNMVERILQMHPQRRAYGMEVEIQERHPSFQEQEWDEPAEDDYVSLSDPIEGSLTYKGNPSPTIRNIFERMNRKD